MSSSVVRQKCGRRLYRLTVRKSRGGRDNPRQRVLRFCAAISGSPFEDEDGACQSVGEVRVCSVLWRIDGIVRVSGDRIPRAVPA